MEKFVINGPCKLNGEVEISGAKNAVVAILPAMILVEGKCRIENIPAISDVKSTLEILKLMGAKIKLIDKKTYEIDCSNIKNRSIEYENAKKLRASYYFIGSLLGRFGEAKVAMPGGCHIGARPIDQHIKSFQALGADIEVINGDVCAKSDELVGAHVYFDVVSVGSTINAMIAATKAKGLTVLENVAKEPHIVDVANFLNSMGANISGAGTDVIKIRGVDRLYGGTYAVIPDQIEAGTFLVAAAATGGEVLVKNIIPKHMECITAKLVEMNAQIKEFDDAIYIKAPDKLQSTSIKTMPYPGFPTDMQPQMAVLMSVASGTSTIREGIWENRFKYVDELKKMGANITVDGKSAIVEGEARLTGAPVKACDLRAGAAMIVAAMVAHGETTIEDIEHIERGYEDIVSKFRYLGANIRKVDFNEEKVIRKLS